MAVYQAQKEGLRNFSILCSHVMVPPAMESILESPDNCVQGFLAAGHVCTVMGYEEYYPIVERHCVPIVVTGFEPIDILQGIHMCVKQLEEGRSEVENQYSRSVKREGNRAAQEIMQQVFQVVSRPWRGIGEIPQSGLGLAEAYEAYDAGKRFNLATNSEVLDMGCMSGLVLQGLKKPHECPHFGERCTPEHPLGATMVSNEGACAAYFQYREWEQPAAH